MNELNKLTELEFKKLISPYRCTFESNTFAVPETIMDAIFSTYYNLPGYITQMIESEFNCEVYIDNDHVIIEFNETTFKP